MKKARRLVDLTIDEVSSVDRGAGKGVRVMLMKRLQQTESGMEDLSILSIAKRAYAAVVRGAISEHRFAEIEKTLATASFPTAPSEAVALSKFFASGPGMEMLRPRQALSPAQNYRLMKSESEGNVPQAVRAQPTDADDADKAIDNLAAAHQKKHPDLSHAQCVAHVLGTPEGGRAYAESKRKHLAKNA